MSLRFRLQGDRAGEEIYFRPHKSTLPDAIQYAPSWRGESNWQLYHGYWGTAAAALPLDRWMRVRVVLRGRRAAVFLGDGRAPAMVVPLARPPLAGPIAVAAFTPAGRAPGGEPVAAVANVRVRPGAGAADFDEEPPPPLPAGLVHRWQLSPPFAVDTAPLVRLPGPSSAKRARWPVFEVEEHGVLVVGRHLEPPVPLAGTIARLVLRAGRDGLQRSIWATATTSRSSSAGGPSSPATPATATIAPARRVSSASARPPCGCRWPGATASFCWP